MSGLNSGDILPALERPLQLQPRALLLLIPCLSAALALVLVLAMALMLSASTGRAQSQGGEFVLEKSTIDAGGQASVGGEFEIIGTIAQPEARPGPASGGAFQVHGGYWPRTQTDFLFNDGFEG